MACLNSPLVSNLLFSTAFFYWQASDISIMLQYGASGAGGSTINQTNNPICDTKYYTKVNSYLVVFTNYWLLHCSFFMCVCQRILTCRNLQIEDRPVVKQITTFVREHHPVEKEFVVETRPTGIVCNST